MADLALRDATLARCVSLSRPARAGLGNELVPFAKAFLAARALGIPLIPPAWGLGRRPYWRHFSRSRVDMAAHAVAMASRRRLTFAEAEYRRTGIVDYGQAIRAWRSRRGDQGQRAVILNEGLWGGFPAIAGARFFIRSYLRGSRYAPGNVTALQSRRRPGTILVAVHVRGGDFLAPAEDAVYGETWNLALPLEWYRDVCRGLRELLGDSVQFLVLGAEGTAGPARSLVDDLGALTTWTERHTDVSDLLLLSMADLAVCSISTFSLVATWLSDSPYVWPSAQLHREDGWMSIWGAETAQHEGQTTANRSELAELDEPPLARGIPVSPDGRLPPEVSRVLESGRTPIWDRRADLIYYGVVRESSSA